MVSAITGQKQAMAIQMQKNDKDMRKKAPSSAPEAKPTTSTSPSNVNHSQKRYLGDVLEELGQDLSDYVSVSQNVNQYI